MLVRYAQIDGWCYLFHDEPTHAVNYEEQRYLKCALEKATLYGKVTSLGPYSDFRLVHLCNI